MLTAANLLDEGTRWFVLIGMQCLVGRRCCNPPNPLIKPLKAGGLLSGG